MFDANVFIYAVEGSEAYQNAIRRLLSGADGTFQIITSELTIGECLIGAAPDLTRIYLELFSNQAAVQLEPVTRIIIEHAAELGGRLALKLPDAIHVVTARNAGCSRFVTNDRRIRVPEPMAKLELRAL
ncbi:MAG: type II toxin-antitoxin system VapC family toxin [Hyphomicrobiales bacterium]